jgi:hypothetical protein
MLSTSPWLLISQVNCDKAKVVCVDSKLVDDTMNSLVGADPSQD